MPPSKRERRGAGGEPPDDGDERPVLGNADADPVRIHRAYVERQLEGGGPATPEAYERALRQWHELPGAVSRPPAEAPDHSTPPPERAEDEQQDEGRDAEPRQ